MKRRKAVFYSSRQPVLATLMFLWSCAAFAAPDSEAWSFWRQADESNRTAIDHSPWQNILDSYLHDGETGLNLFAYGAVSTEDRERLNHYLDEMQLIDPRDYRSEEQLAYWVNLYNALTVELILENYPVKSITKLGRGLFKFGPWDDPVASIAGQELTLNDIEHRILRPIWGDPRIHFVVNCASIGCPNLQITAFTAENTEALMVQAAFDYLTHPRGVYFQRDGDLQLSSIFDWYRTDFGHDQTELLKTLASYASPELAERLRGYEGSIDYEYDWTLNEYSTDGL